MLRKRGNIVLRKGVDAFFASIGLSYYWFCALLENRKHLSAKYLCDRIAVIHNGVIVETGPTLDVIDHPSHPYTKTLIAAQPSFGICPIL